MSKEVARGMRGILGPEIHRKWLAEPPNRRTAEEAARAVRDIDTDSDDRTGRSALSAPVSGGPPLSFATHSSWGILGHSKFSCSIIVMMDKVYSGMTFDRPS